MLTSDNELEKRGIACALSDDCNISWRSQRRVSGNAHREVLTKRSSWGNKAARGCQTGGPQVPGFSSPGESATSHTDCPYESFGERDGRFARATEARTNAVKDVSTFPPVS